jgi:hypothetical protein
MRLKSSGAFERVGRSPSGDANAFGPWSFRSAALGVGYLLTFVQVLEGHALDCRLMEKQLALGPLDKPKAFVVDELLDGTFGHVAILSKE